MFCHNGSFSSMTSCCAAFWLEILSILLVVLYAGQRCPALELSRPRLGKAFASGVFRIVMGAGAPEKKHPMLAMFKGEHHCFWVITSVWETHNTGNESNNLWHLISINVLWMGGRWAFIHSTCKLSDEKWCSRFWYIARLQFHDARVGKSHFLRNRNTFQQPLEMRYLSGWNHRFPKLEDGNIEHPYICPIKEGFAIDFPEKSIISIHRPLPSLRTELCEATNCRMFGWLTGATTSVERGTWLWLVPQNWFYLLGNIL